MLVFEGKTTLPGEKPLGPEYRTHKLNPHMTPTLGLNPGHVGGNCMPCSMQMVCGTFYVPRGDEHREAFETGPTVYCALSKKTRESNRLQMALQRQHFLLSYLILPSIGLASVLIPGPPTQ